jgi:molybdenum cofactor sulfurtransferase
MALLRPKLDFKTGKLHIRLDGSNEDINIALSLDPTCFSPSDLKSSNANVCGDTVRAQVYTSSAIAAYLTRALGVPCTLARFPRGHGTHTSLRHSKPHLKSLSQQNGVPRPLLLSNESPILTISRSSLNRLNEQIKAKGGKAAHPSVFRANIILTESPLQPPGQERPWAEDSWESMQIGGPDGPELDFLGGCRRCQMVCVDQESAEKNEEPFVTLAKTRRFDGRVLFGVHSALANRVLTGQWPTIMVGDAVGTRSGLIDVEHIHRK